MLDYIHRPISDRGPFTGEHKGSLFDSTFNQTLRLLEDELWYLNGTNVVIEIDVAPGDIRLDGKQRASSRALSPAVRLVFDSMHGQLSYATDRFVRNYKGPTEDWKHNLRAIALGLEALRKVDRYGIGQSGEQYTGYLALEAGSGGIALGGMTATEAESIISGVVGAFDRSEGRERLRRARAMSHPDRHGGDQSLWDQVELAARVLGLDS